MTEPTPDSGQSAADPGALAPRRQGEATRRALIQAAVSVFAEHGYEAASVRVITAKAKVNQGAITYHFGGKDGLYRAVLETVRDSLSAQPLRSAADVDRYTPEETVRLFIRQTLAALGESMRAKRYLRVMAWEQLRPTAVRRRLSAEKPFATVVLAGRIVRRLRPEADERTVAVATAWLMGQIVTFVRDGEYLAAPPFSLVLDAASLDELVERLTELCLGGLAEVGPRHQA